MSDNNPDCIFCKIANKEIAVPFVYENDLVVAFDDMAPQAPVHTLIIPKQHVANLEENPSDVIIAAVFGAAREVARIKGIENSGYRLVQNNGGDSGQTVFHMHVHVLGGTTLQVGMA